MSGLSHNLNIRTLPGPRGLISNRPPRSKYLNMQKPHTSSVLLSNRLHNLTIQKNQTPHVLCPAPPTPLTSPQSPQTHLYRKTYTYSNTPNPTRRDVVPRNPRKDGRVHSSTVECSTLSCPCIARPGQRSVCSCTQREQAFPFCFTRHEDDTSHTVT
jgi:hypothetical protein